MSDDTNSSRSSLAVSVAVLVDKVSQMAQDFAGLRQEIREALKENKEDLRRLEDRMDEKLEGYVSADSFEPVKMLAYGAAGTILVGFLTAAVYFVLHIPQ